MPSASSPKPVGSYLSAVRSGNLVFVSNMDSEAPKHPNLTGPLWCENLPVALAAAERCAENIVSAAAALLAPDERISDIASLRCSLVTDPGFAPHMSQLAEACLFALADNLNLPRKAALTVYGAAGLPGNSALEADAILVVSENSR